MTARTGTPAEAFSATAEAYAESIAPNLARAAAEVVRRAALRPGERVLDVGTGTGVAAAAAQGEGRRIVGLDAAPGMLEIARRTQPDLEFIEADMAAMPFDDGSFDVALSVHAVQFATDRVAALAEIRRVVAPGGRLSMSVPGPRHLTPPGVFADIYQSFGLAVPADEVTAEVIASWARDAGWADVRTEADPSFQLRLAGEDGLRRWLATGPRAAASAGWSQERRDELRGALLARLDREEDGTVLLPFGALYLTARRPEAERG